MSSAADRPASLALPASWERLERAVEDAALGATFWKRRALEAEEEVERLRDTLEELAAQRQARPGEDEMQRLRAQNAALNSRMQQARKRVAALLKHLATLRLEP